MKNHDHVFCLLGTTRAKSGPEGFVKIDKDYVLNVAQAARDANVPHFHLMTSQGIRGQIIDNCQNTVVIFCNFKQFNELKLSVGKNFLCQISEICPLCERAQTQIHGFYIQKQKAK